MIVFKKNLHTIAATACILRAGGVCAFPTDTAYAIGCVFNNKAAIRRLLAVKRRTDNKFTVVAADLAMVKRYFKLTPQQMAVAKRYWPGPLSIVVSRRFSVRVPANATTRQLCTVVDAPLIASSANISGKKAAYNVAAIKKQFSKVLQQPDVALDDGPLAEAPVSTIIKVNARGISVLRQGSVAPTI